MEDWIVVDEPVARATRALESNAAPAKTKEEAAEEPPTRVADVAPQLIAPEPKAPSIGNHGSSEQPAFGFADVLRNMNDFQRAGLGLYDLYSDQLQGKFHDFKEAATTRSRWALERARLEAQRMLATLSATEVSEYLAQSSLDFDDRASVSKESRSGSPEATAPSKQEAALECGSNAAALEKWLGANLVPMLFEAKVPLFDGRDAKEWFAGASPYFDSVVTKSRQTCAMIVLGVKLYSLPSVAATIDEADFSGLSSKEEAVDTLTQFFDERRARTRRYKELLRINTQSSTPI